MSRLSSEVLAKAVTEGLTLLTSSSASGYRGVYKHNGHWRAQLRRRFGAGKHDNASNWCGKTRAAPIEAALDYARLLHDADG